MTNRLISIVAYVLWNLTQTPKQCWNLAATASSWNSFCSGLFHGSKRVSVQYHYGILALSNVCIYNIVCLYLSIYLSIYIYIYIAQYESSTITINSYENEIEHNPSYHNQNRIILLSSNLTTGRPTQLQTIAMGRRWAKTPLLGKVSDRTS